MRGVCRIESGDCAKDQEDSKQYRENSPIESSWAPAREVDRIDQVVGKSHKVLQLAHDHTQEEDVVVRHRPFPNHYPEHRNQVESSEQLLILALYTPKQPTLSFLTCLSDAW